MTDVPKTIVFAGRRRKLTFVPYTKAKWQAILYDSIRLYLVRTELHGWLARLVGLGIDYRTSGSTPQEAVKNLEECWLTVFRDIGHALNYDVEE